jgi:hypothetical protein
MQEDPPLIVEQLADSQLRQFDTDLRTIESAEDPF